MEKEMCTFSDCLTKNLEKGIEEKLYRENINVEMIMKFYFILIFGIHESPFFQNLPLSEILKAELKVLEYHKAQ